MYDKTHVFPAGILQCRYIVCLKSHVGTWCKLLHACRLPPPVRLCWSCSYISQAVSAKPQHGWQHTGIALCLFCLPIMAPP